MSRVRHRGEAPSSGGSQAASSRDFLERLARILVGSGHSPKALSREFRDICANLSEPTQHFDPAHLAFVADLPHVIARWHTDPRFMDSSGAPLRLPLRARGASLTGLIRTVLPATDPDRVVRALLDLRAVTREGHRYRPHGRYLAYDAQHSSALAHGLTALLGMMSTLERNLFGRKKGVLLERAAMNPHFPVGHLERFHAELKEAAGNFLFSVDRNMRRYEASGTRSRTKRLGVCVFAFEEPHVGGPRRVSKHRARARRRVRAP